MNRRPDPSKKRKVSFEDSANTLPSHQQSLQLGSRFIMQSLPSPDHDSWSSPEHHQSTGPEHAPDFLETLINQLEEAQQEDPGASTLFEQPSTAPFVQQEGSLGGDPREALGSEVVNLLQLITQNIPLMHDPCDVPAGTAAMQPNLVGISLVGTGHPLTYDWVCQGLQPCFGVIPSQCSNMGLPPNGLLAPLVYQPTSLNEQCFATPVSADTLLPSEASVPQCTAESEVQSVLAALLDLTSQISITHGLQSSGLLMQGCGSVPVTECYIPVQQSDWPFTQPSEFPCI